jgi:hypothetical protein
MTTVVLTPSERDELVVHANAVDPPRKGVLVGDAVACAIFAKRIPDSYTRPVGTDAIEIPVGWSVSQTCAHDPVTGEVGIDAEIAAKITVRSGCSAGLKAKLVAAVPVPEPALKGKP